MRSNSLAGMNSGMTDLGNIERDNNVVSLREITFASVRDVLALEVHQWQRGYVASNATSIAEGHFNPGAWFRAVYADETPVGFVALLDPEVPGAISRGVIRAGEVLLWRLMIDRRYQRRGYARQALDLLRSHIRSRPGVIRLISSYVPGDHGPEAFYLRYGFQKTGRFRADGREVEIWITP
jgi:diamine N-acetyltransferase